MDRSPAPQGLGAALGEAGTPDARRPGPKRRVNGRPQPGAHRRRTARPRAAAGPEAGHVLVGPQGGEAQLACRRASRAQQPSSNSTVASHNPTPRTLMDAWEAATSSIRAFPRSAMNRCPAGGMARSSVPTRYDDGIDRHPAGPEGVGRCCICCERARRRQTVTMRTRRPRPPAIARSAFAGFCFPADVIVLAVRWYLRFALSYRDVEELLAERGVEVDHVTIYRWVQRFTPLLADAARPCRHAVGDRWQVDETYVKVAGRWRYVYRAIDQFGQVIDVFVSSRRDTKAAHCFFERAIGTTAIIPVEIITDQAAAYPAVLDELLPAAWHCTERY